MKKRCRIVLLLTIFSLTGCGEFAYKRGAGAADLNKAQLGCQAQSSDPAAIEACLEKEGWTVQKLDALGELDPVAVITPNPDNRSPGVTSLAAAQAQVADPAGTNAPKKPADPLDVFKISSWWKMGGSTDQLNGALNACVATLGESHRPDPLAQRATRGLLLCMRQSGWYGLQGR